MRNRISCKINRLASDHECRIATVQSQMNFVTLTKCNYLISTYIKRQFNIIKFYQYLQFGFQDKRELPFSTLALMYRKEVNNITDLKILFYIISSFSRFSILEHILTNKSLQCLPGFCSPIYLQLELEKRALNYNT